jgi:glycosyltransferase involved in cell wall biosynthesis
MMGYGDMVSYLKETVEKYPNIHYKEAVPVNEIIAYTSSTDVGVHYLPFSLSMSYRFSLPNKFFEYLIGSLPIIVSNSLEYLSKIIKDNNLGWVLSNDKEEFINFINSIDKKQIESKQEDAFLYAKRNGWQFEEKILKEIYS